MPAKQRRQFVLQNQTLEYGHSLILEYSNLLLVRLTGSIDKCATLIFNKIHFYVTVGGVMSKVEVYKCCMKQDFKSIASYQAFYFVVAEDKQTKKECITDVFMFSDAILMGDNMARMTVNVLGKRAKLDNV